MSRPPRAAHEGPGEPCADARLRALAKLDSLEPSRALDRAVLGLAREAASGRARSTRADRGLIVRWSLPAALAAAAVCAVLVHRTTSRPGAGAPPAAERLPEPMPPPQREALERVTVSARYSAATPRVDAAGASGSQPAPPFAGDSPRWLMPLYIEASAPLQRPPPRRREDRARPRDPAARPAGVLDTAAHSRPR